MLSYRNRFILALNRPGVIHDQCQFYDCEDCGDPFKPGDCESKRYCQGCLEVIVSEENEGDDMAKVVITIEDEGKEVAIDAKFDPRMPRSEQEMTRAQSMARSMITGLASKYQMKDIWSDNGSFPNDL